MNLHVEAQAYANKFLWDKAGLRLKWMEEKFPDWDVEKWTQFWIKEIKIQENDFNKAYSAYRRNNGRPETKRQSN